MVKITNFFSVLSIVGYLFFNIESSFAQDTKRYFVFLKDKKNTNYSIQKPEDFLTNKSIQRRKKQNIPITESDLPVNSLYLKQISQKGAKIWYTSRWFNAVLLEADASTISSIQNLPFVKPDILLASPRKVKNGSKETPPNELKKISEVKIKTQIEIAQASDYGRSLNQIKMIGADQMHENGFKGKGMTIAVFDSGFENLPNLAFFKHLFDNQQILGTYNLVDNNTNVYQVGTHGTQVLSAIAAYEKGKIVGTAPEAFFYLFRTEDNSSEYRIEEINWLIAAEKADSLGVDVINSSLGYNTFDDASMDYTYKMIDGNTALVTQAADFAARTGILVVASAGNEGTKNWQYITPPADADSVLTVGATDSEGNYVNFSSRGFENKIHIKPDVSAQGLATVVGTSSNYVGSNSGTSFSCPLICGFATALWQANPTLTNIELIQIIKETASQAQKPDRKLGYGIPNFKKAHDLAQLKKKKNTKSEK